jgi:hypothetical protein
MEDLHAVALGAAERARDGTAELGLDARDVGEAAHEEDSLVALGETRQVEGHRRFAQVVFLRRLAGERGRDFRHVGFVADALDGVRIGKRVVVRDVAVRIAIHEERGNVVLARQTQRFEDAVARLDEQVGGALRHLVANDRQERQPPNGAADGPFESRGELDGDAVGPLAQERLAHCHRERKRPVEDGRVQNARAHADWETIPAWRLTARS